MPVYDDEDTNNIDSANPTQKDEIAELEDMFNAPSYGSDDEIDGLNEQFESPSYSEEKIDDNKDTPNNKDNSEKENSDSLYKPDTVKAKVGKARNWYGTKKKNTLYKAKKVRKFMILTGGIGLVIFGLVTYLIMQLGANKLIQITESVTAWNTARSARAFRLGTKQLLEESVATNTDNASYLNKLRTAFGESKAGAMVDRYNNLFRPEKVFKNLKADIKPVYFEKRFQGLEIGRAFLSYEDPSLKNKIFHPLETRADRIRFAGEIDGVIQERLKGSSSFVRNSVYKKIMNKYGLKYNFLYKKSAAFKNASQQASERLVLQETLENTLDDEAVCLIHKTLCAASQKADDVVKETVEEALDNPNAGGAIDVEEKAIEAASKEVLGAQAENNILKYVGKTSLVYSVMVPICIIYAGSIVNSGPTIDRNETSATKDYLANMTMADEAKSGELPTEAIMAANAVLGDYTDSIPYARDSGRNVDSSKQINSLFQPESSNIGIYGPAQAIFGNNAISSVVDKMADKACPIITDPLAGAAVVGLELALQIIIATSSGGTSGGASQAGKEAVDQATQSAMKRILNAVFIPTTRAIYKEQGAKAATGFVVRSANKFVAKTGLYIAGVSQLTILSRSFVLKQSSVQHSGIMSGASKINQLDMGANLAERNVNRDILYGAPMTTEDVIASRESDAKYIAQNNKNRSIYERYLSTTNPFSLVSKAGHSLTSSVNNSKKIITNIVGPVKLGLKNFGSIFSVKVFANEPTLEGAGDYNIVQWGWTERELRYLENDKTGEYAAIYNKLLVTSDDRLESVKQKYEKCFTETVGTLLAEERIDREENGRVVEDTGDINDCSPRNLGYANPEFGDLVFRWRLMNYRDAMINHFYQAQELTDEIIAL